MLISSTIFLWAVHSQAVAGATIKKSNPKNIAILNRFCPLILPIKPFSPILKPLPFTQFTVETMISHQDKLDAPIM